MLSELAIGRKVGRSVLLSYQSVCGRWGTFIGWLAMLSPFLILSFYASSSSVSSLSAGRICVALSIYSTPSRWSYSWHITRASKSSNS